MPLRLGGASGCCRGAQRHRAGCPATNGLCGHKQTANICSAQHKTTDHLDKTSLLLNEAFNSLLRLIEFYEHRDAFAIFNCFSILFQSAASPATSLAIASNCGCGHRPHSCHPRCIPTTTTMPHTDSEASREAERQARHQHSASVDQRSRALVPMYVPYFAPEYRRTVSLCVCVHVYSIMELHHNLTQPNIVIVFPNN